MSSTSSNTSDPSTLQGNETNESELENSDSPTSEIKDGETKNSEAPRASSSDSLKRIAEEAGLSNTSSNLEVGSPKKNSDMEDMETKNYDEETAFSELVDKTLEIFQPSKNTPGTFEVMKVKRSFNHVYNCEKGKDFSDINFQDVENICAYLYRYCATIAGLTRFRTLQALNNCSDLLRQLAAFSSINILSLGSGHGFDIIGLCSALYEQVKGRKVKLTLAHSVEDWSSVFNTVEELVKEGEYGKASHFFKDHDVTTRYLHTDLSNVAEKDEAYLSALKEADVVLMNRLFSRLMKNNNETDRTAKIVSDTMKTGAVLLFIDYLKDNAIYDFKNMKNIYHHEYNEYQFKGKTTTRPQISSEISMDSKAQINVYIKET